MCVTISWPDTVLSSSLHSILCIICYRARQINGNYKSQRKMLTEQLKNADYHPYLKTLIKAAGEQLAAPSVRKYPLPSWLTYQNLNHSNPHFFVSPAPVFQDEPTTGRLWLARLTPKAMCCGSTGATPARASVRSLSLAPPSRWKKRFDRR